MIHQFDHRWATYAGAQATLAGNNEADGARDSLDAEKAHPDYTVTPRYWVERAEVEARLRDKQWSRGWLMGWRDICRSTYERTVIAAVFPRQAAGDTLLLMFPSQSAALCACLVGDQNSLVHDYVARQKIGGTHLKYHVKKQVTNLPPAAYTPEALAFIVPRVLELTYTAFDLQPFYDDVVAENPAFDSRPASERGKPFPWHPERRAQLRAELDAYYARLYGLTRDELRYILDPADVMGADYPSETFRVLKDKETRQYGEYRTQRLVLAAWDRLEAGELR
jgi:hypothetical protein